jgi:hypothetical protein
LRSALLYEPKRHEALSAIAWDEAHACAAIEQIAADAHREFTPEGLWRIHPLDRSPERPPDSIKPLYHGAAGVIWALTYLAEAGAVERNCDYLPTVRELRARNRDDLRRNDGQREYMRRELGCYLVGETGMLLLEWKLAPSDKVAQELYDEIESRIGDPRGLAWGASGTMLAALFMHERTGEPRWRDLFLRNFDALWDQWRYDSNLGCHLWTHDLYGVTEKRLGAIHGLAGTVFPMIRGRQMLPADRVSELFRRIVEALNATALRENGALNWPNNVGASSRPTPLPLFLQHCNGAAGIINCMADLPAGEIDSILLDAGVLIWNAGPLVKLPSLCHGTPGNGYAMLKLYVRTGDPIWLERARLFAMHSIEQCERALAIHGQRKYSLWTGDLGLAVFLWDCIRGVAKLPTMEVF